jgi:hypothetical protein
VKSTSGIKICGYVLTEFHDNVENPANFIGILIKIWLSLQGFTRNLRLLKVDMWKSRLPNFTELSEETLYVQLGGNIACPYIKCDCRCADVHDTSACLLDS